MPAGPPPPRYRVVEQGRRLVVIDTRTGSAIERHAPPARSDPPSRLPTAPRRTDFAGRSTLVTHPLYDDRAPRTLTLDEAATRLIDGVRVCAIGGAVMFAVIALYEPLLFAVPLVLVSPKVRSAIRARITRWLDRYDAGASVG